MASCFDIQIVVGPVAPPMNDDTSRKRRFHHQTPRLLGRKLAVEFRDLFLPDYIGKFLWMYGFQIEIEEVLKILLH